MHYFVAQIYATLIIVDKNQNIVKSVLKENNLTIAMQMRNFDALISTMKPRPIIIQTAEPPIRMAFHENADFVKSICSMRIGKMDKRSINTPSTTIDKRRNFFANDRWCGEKLVRSAYCRYSKPEPEIIKNTLFFQLLIFYFDRFL